ncbi:hypothetical protein NpPPO83_00010050 [Neofusicoccum parvum]|uniref:Uncharacterized protein n=1 Tax=Neofusicoccum parvum TaxID=310453 RepID=A0ACB5RNT6_9PEZI|nr:hypothetical protein NpPPO83_00010050 [Neofusicoccum parvum]
MRIRVLAWRWIDEPLTAAFHTMDLHFRAAVALAPVSWSPRDPRRTRFENFFYNISVIEEGECCICVEVIDNSRYWDTTHISFACHVAIRSETVV